jgi:hypothetical protein
MPPAAMLAGDRLGEAIRRDERHLFLLLAVYEKTMKLVDRLEVFECWFGADWNGNDVDASRLNTEACRSRRRRPGHSDLMAPGIPR